MPTRTEFANLNTAQQQPACSRFIDAGSDEGHLYELDKVGGVLCRQQPLCGELCIHYLSREVLTAERLSASKVAAKVRAGWQWRRLVPGFGAAGGTASYSRALVSPQGELAFVSDRAAGMEDLGTLAPLEISYRLVTLAVPFAEKDAAKALGAVWVGHRKCWACAPDRVNEFQRWLPNNGEEFELLES